MVVGWSKRWTDGPRSGHDGELGCFFSYRLRIGLGIKWVDVLVEDGELFPRATFYWYL